jgi:hypothetical protein
MYVINSVHKRSGRPFGPHGVECATKTEAAKKAAKAIERACKRGLYRHVTITVESRPTLPQSN